MLEKMTARREQTAENMFVIAGLLIPPEIRPVQDWLFWGNASGQPFNDFCPIRDTLFVLKMASNLAGCAVNKLTLAMPWSAQFKSTAYGRSGANGAKAYISFPAGKKSVLLHDGYALKPQGYQQHI